MDPLTAQCVGCLRTIDEITGWRELGNGQKLMLWRVLRARRDLLPPDKLA